VGLDELGVLHTVTQETKQEGAFPFQAGVGGFLCVGCTKILEQRVALSSQSDVGRYPETTTTVQVASRKKFAKLPRGQQQRRVITWSAEQTKKFNLGG
jgi:hypothetical protein